MESVAWQQELPFQTRRPTGADEFEIELFVRPIDFVADDGMAQRSEVNADLVRPAGARRRAKNSERLAIATEPAHHDKIGKRGSTCGMDHLLQPDWREN